MPQQDVTAYEYQPEESVTTVRFMQVLTEIEREDGIDEDINLEQLKCETGACPI